MRPRLVRRLILVAPAGLRPFPAAISRLLATSADAALAARRKAVSLTEVAWGRRLLLAMTAANGAGMPPTLARQMVEASATARRTEPALATITSTDLRPVLGRTQAPVGVIWGEADRTVPIRALEELVAVRPDAQVVRISDAGHVPMIERPEAFTRRARVAARRTTSPAYQIRHNFRLGAPYRAVSRDFPLTRYAPRTKRSLRHPGSG